MSLWFGNRRHLFGRPSAQSSCRIYRHGMSLLAILVCIGLVVRHVMGGNVGVSCHPALASERLSRHGRRQTQSTGTGCPDASLRVSSYSRFSSDMQREESITDQQRKCHEKAAANGHRILPALEFQDEAVSGTKRNRNGLNALVAAAEAGEIDVLYVYSLSRLSRESVITLPLLKHLVYNCRVRVISVTEGVDSRDTAWELIAHIMSIVHEQYVKDLAESVFRGQEGIVLSEDGVGRALGDHCFGFSSTIIPGSEPVQRGRQSKPRKMYVIDPETAAWVQRIFHWFVTEKQSLRWIVRELNRLGAPKDHRASTHTWRHQYLPGLLQNRKYIGWWPWGEKKNVRDPLTGTIRQEERAPEECEQWVRHLPHLRLIDDETFAEAQRLLASNAEANAASRNRKGQFNGARPRSSSNHPRHLLSQLIVCSHCERTFHVGGTHGKYLFCPGYATGECSCQTQLRRDRAERMILAVIGQRILDNPLWHQQVRSQALAAWRVQEATIPTELAAAQRTLAEVDQKIEKLLDRIENGHGGPELDTRLTQRRQEKRELTGRVARLQGADQERRPQPTATWIEEQLRNLGSLLTESTPAAAHALRDLVGGAIAVEEVRLPGRQRHFLRGTFSVSSQAIVKGLVGTAQQPGSAGSPATDSVNEEIVIDFREPPEIEKLSEQVKELYDLGLMNAEIAERLHCCRSRVSLALKVWHESRGLEMPDGRSRRSTLQKKHLLPPLYQQIADQVMELYEQDLLLEEIALRLHHDRNTVTSAVRWWHEQRGLSVPDGRTRRKSLDCKCSKLRETEPEREEQEPPAVDGSGNETTQQ